MKYFRLHYRIINTRLLSLLVSPSELTGSNLGKIQKWTGSK